MSRRSFKWLWRLLGILIFIFILSRLNIGELKSIFSQMRLSFFLAAIPLFFLIILAKALRWRYILLLQGIKAPLSDLYKVYMASFYLGSVTPGRAGELIKYLYVRQRGSELGVSLFGTVFDRLLDLLFVITVGYIGMYFFASFLEEQLIYISILILVTAIVSAILVWKKELTTKIYYFLLNILVPEKFRDKSHQVVKEFLNEFKKTGLRLFDLPLFFTFLSWLFYYSQVYLLANSLGIKISFFYLSIFVSIAALIALFPVTFQGIGTRDATLVFFFSLLGLTAEKAVALSLTMLLLFTIHALIGLFFWVKAPMLV
jgi:uncharacterized protein (TIRG00374 family)